MHRDTPPRTSTRPARQVLPTSTRRDVRPRTGGRGHGDDADGQRHRHLDAGPGTCTGGRSASRARVPVSIMEDGDGPDPLLAEHGFSVLVTVARNGSAPPPLRRRHQPGRRCGEHGPARDRSGRFEAIICSHGHFDHTTGLDGLIRRLGTANLPVLIHPHFWRRRRVAIPGRDPMEIPTHQPQRADRRRVRGDRGGSIRASCSTGPCW